jgi:dihydrofolate reductase
MGHTIVMGRRTWESIGRPLPGRRTVVVSRQPDYRIDIEGVHTTTSLDDALRMAEAANDDAAFVVGGAEMYREALLRADRLYLTRVLADVEGDTFFPEIDGQEWRRVSSEHHAAGPMNEHPFNFQVYERA